MIENILSAIKKQEQSFIEKNFKKISNVHQRELSLLCAVEYNNVDAFNFIKQYVPITNDIENKIFKISLNSSTFNPQLNPYIFNPHVYSELSLNDVQKIVNKGNEAIESFFEHQILNFAKYSNLFVICCLRSKEFDFLEKIFNLPLSKEQTITFALTCIVFKEFEFLPIILENSMERNVIYSSFQKEDIKNFSKYFVSENSFLVKILHLTEKKNFFSLEKAIETIDIAMKEAFSVILKSQMQLKPTSTSKLPKQLKF